MHLLVKERSPYNEITVYETSELFGERGRFRVLEFGGNAVQGAVNLKAPAHIVLEYPRAVIHLMEYNLPSFNRLFMIGHGIGTIAGRYPERDVIVAEIDERVVTASRTLFGYTRDNIAIGDGRQLLSEQTPCRYDFIVVDAFTKAGTPVHLTSLQFAELAREKLALHGCLIMNLAGRPVGDKRMNAIGATLREAFRHVAAFVLPGRDADRREERNLLLVAGNREILYDPHSMAGFVQVELEQGYIIRDKG
ncbi:spermidine synthase [Paenibacillus chartarius]|uniref:Spermidine synthase n=1 Tax=Paenibacillus chartarius TaxID=747481 RepID=A0ABV6DHT3_9BACL